MSAQYGSQRRIRVWQVWCVAGQCSAGPRSLLVLCIYLSPHFDIYIMVEVPHAVLVCVQVSAWLACNRRGCPVGMCYPLLPSSTLSCSLPSTPASPEGVVWAGLAFHAPGHANSRLPPAHSRTAFPSNSTRKQHGACGSPAPKAQAGPRARCPSWQRCMGPTPSSLPASRWAWLWLWWAWFHERWGDRCGRERGEQQGDARACGTLACACGTLARTRMAGGAHPGHPQGCHLCACLRACMKAAVASPREGRGFPRGREHRSGAHIMQPCVRACVPALPSPHLRCPRGSQNLWLNTTYMGLACFPPALHAEGSAVQALAPTHAQVLRPLLRSPHAHLPAG